MKKLFALGALAVLSLGTLISCGNDNTEPNNDPLISGEGKTISLEYSGTASNQEFNESLFEKFKEDRKAKGDKNTYEITYVAHGPDKIDSEVLDWTEGPDVYEFASDKITTLYQKGALAQLGKTYENFVKENNNQLGVQLAQHAGKFYAYPYTGDNTYYLQYDKSLFTEEDVKSVERILEVCAEKKVKFGYNLPEGFWGGGAMFTFGADYKMSFNPDGSALNIEADFDSEKGLKAAKAIYKIVNDPSWTKSADVPTPENKIGICIDGTWKITDYKAELGENYGCAVMPTITIDGETKHLGAFLGGKLFGVNPQRAGSDKSRILAAHQLAMFLSNEESQLARYENQNVVPCNIKAAAADSVKNNINSKVLAEQAEFAHAQVAVPDKFWDAPATLVNGIADGTIKEDGLQDAVNSFNTTVKTKA